MTLRERIVNELKKRLEESNYQAITIQMKSDLALITIIPTAIGIVESVYDIDYFLVECSLPWCGNDTLDDVAEFIMNYDMKVQESNKEKQQLKEFYNAHKHDSNTNWWNYYSDWYKDVYGHRP